MTKEEIINEITLHKDFRLSRGMALFLNTYKNNDQINLKEIKEAYDLIYSEGTHRNKSYKKHNFDSLVALFNRYKVIKSNLF